MAKERLPTFEPYSITHPDGIELGLPIRTCSEANSFDHWSSKYRRHQSQKIEVYYSLVRYAEKLKTPCSIHLVRYAPRMLDRWENLPMAFKYILDAICEVITDDKTPGRADSHEGIKVTYDQKKSSNYGIKIIIKNLE